MTTSPRILVVDDEAFIRSYLEDVLEEEGYEVMGASNGHEALEQLRKGDEPDLIMLDLMMPVMNGWEFREAQLKDPALARIPVLIVSGAGDVEGEARRLHAAGCVVKPFHPANILSSIARLCR